MTTAQRFLLSTTALSGAVLLAAAPAWAQTPERQTPNDPVPPLPSSAAQAPNDSTEVEAVTVVGSRIRRDTFNSPSPVQIITREESTLAGFNSTTEALQSTAVTTGSAQINNAFGGFVTDGGPGANTLSLRGLGAGRTLVLINGRRIAPAGTRGAVGSADLNVLPDAIVDRVEILRDGASSIYGSDAIAGVVNIITQTDVDRLSVEGQYNRPTSEGGEQFSLSVVGGISRDRFNISGSLEYYERTDLTLNDRDWTRCNLDLRRNPATGGTADFIDPLTGQPKCYPITGTGSNGVTINTIGTNNAPGFGAPGSLTPGAVGTFNRFRPNSAIPANAAGNLAGFEGVGGPSSPNLNVRDTFDPRTLRRSLISPVKTYNAFVQGSYDLNALGDAEIYGEFLGSRRESEQTGYRQLSLDYRRFSALIPANLQFSNFAADQGTSGGERVGVRAFIGFGNDASSQKVDAYKATVGIKGDFFIPDWRYDLTGSFSDSDAEYKQQSFLTDKVTFASDDAIAPAGFDPSLVRNIGGTNYTCAINITNPAERCILYPVLNAQTIAGQLPSDLVNYIFRDVTGNTTYSEAVLTGIFDGPLFRLPAGEVQSVVGFEYRKAEIDDTPDINSINSNLYNLTSATPTRGEDSVREAFAEVEVPVLADLPFANELTLNASYRYTDYESYGADSTYKLGVLYSPVDWVSFRATKGTSFRAPALYEQFQGPTSGFLSQAGDPCNNYGAPGVNPARAANCAQELAGNPAGGNFQATQSIRTFSLGGANAGLEAETSENVTYGLILQPPLGDFGDLSIAVDYFDIQIDNGVDQAGAGNILPLCYDDPQFRAGGGFCNLVTRDPNTTALTVNNAYTNIASVKVEGIDYTVRFEKEVGPGDLRLNLQLTQYMEQSSKLFPDDPFEDVNGTINVPEFAGAFDVTYTMENWVFRYGLDWIASMDSYEYLGEDPATSQFDFAVPDYFLHGASAQYEVDDDFEITVGVRNLFDTDPPSISSGFYNRVGNAPLYSGYDYVGREVFINLAKTF